MFLVVAIICGVICAICAHSKGRSKIGWFFIGFFLGIIGLVVILVVSNLKDARAKEEHLEMEQRRLREQLRQERLKNEQFRKHTYTRLDAHDDALQLDTRSITAALDQEQIKMLDEGNYLLEENELQENEELPADRELHNDIDTPIDQEYLNDLTHPKDFDKDSPADLNQDENFDNR